MPVYGFDENKNKVEVPSVASFTNEDLDMTVLPNGLKLYRYSISNVTIPANGGYKFGISLGTVGQTFAIPQEVTCLATPKTALFKDIPITATASIITTVNSGGDIYSEEIKLYNIGSEDVNSGCEVLLLGF